MVLVQGGNGGGTVDVIGARLRTLADVRSVLSRSTDSGNAFSFSSGVSLQAAADGENPILEITNNSAISLSIDKIVLSVSGAGGSPSGRGRGKVYINSASTIAGVGSPTNLNTKESNEFDGTLGIADGTNQTVSSGDVVSDLLTGDDSIVDLFELGTISISNGKTLTVSYANFMGNADVAVVVYGYYAIVDLL